MREGRKICVAIVALGLLIGWPTGSNAATGPWDKYVSVSSLGGGMLAQECGARSGLELDGRVGYILGISDQLSIDRKMCLDGGARTAQIIAVVRKYLRDNPEKWNFAPSHLVATPLVAAFPCAQH